MEAVNKVGRKAPQPAVMATIFNIDKVDASNGEIKHQSDIDLWIPEEEVRAHPVEDLVPYQLDTGHLERTVMLESKLCPDVRAELKQFLQEHRNVFALSHEDMPGINPAEMCHQLCINPKHKPMVLKRKAFNLERYKAINEEVKKLLTAGLIQEVSYPK